MAQRGELGRQLPLRGPLKALVSTTATPWQMQFRETMEEHVCR
uniref:Uncharacterized protein n=1 Tax=Arundo donax TaxID=35708 RepID=A0A0A8ZFN4_ARUDO